MCRSLRVRVPDEDQPVRSEELERVSAMRPGVQRRQERPTGSLVAAMRIQPLETVRFLASSSPPSRVIGSRAPPQVPWDRPAVAMIATGSPTVAHRIAQPSAAIALGVNPSASAEYRASWACHADAAPE
jgi:hypothetical protein